MNKVIEINNIIKNYNDFRAINNLSLEVNQGDIYGLLGPNGAGKSTTINILLGFLKPDLGSIYINGIDSISKFKEIKASIGYIPENVSLYPYLTGIENLSYFCKLNNKNYTNKQLRRILNKCGLESYAHNSKTNTYSKGMRQKIGIAIAVAKKAQIYLLDEPASGLDPLSSNELSELLKKIADEGATILMASHDIFRIGETCNRIGIIKQGIIVKEINTSDVTTKKIENIYIEYMKN